MALGTPYLEFTYGLMVLLEEQGICIDDWMANVDVQGNYL